jgi:hypothetical protein
MAAPDFNYGALMSAQGRGGYQVQRLQPQSAFDTQNWAGLAAASAQASATRDAATINAAANTAQAGISSYGQLASSTVNAYSGLGQQALAGKANVTVAEKAIEQEKARRGSGIGAIAGMAAGVAGLLID